MNLYLVDGYGFVFRAYHSMPPLTNPEGKPVGAVYGFTNMLYKFIMNHEADMLAVVLDSGKKTFRHDIFPEYKSNRPEPPEDLIEQFPVIRDVIDAFNVKYVDKENLEADDIIATLAKKAAAEGINVKVISSDKDLMQLVGENIEMHDPLKGKSIKRDEVIEKFGIAPEQVLDYLSIVGDSSDFVPGVKGIGAKGAVDILKQFETLENVYEQIESVQPERRKKLLLESKDNAFLSKQLITLKDNAELDVTFEDLKVKDVDADKLGGFLKKNGFKALLSRLSKDFKVEVKEDEKPVEKQKNTEFVNLKSTDEILKVIPKIVIAGTVSIYFDDKEFQFSFEDQNYKIEYDNSAGQKSLFEDENSENSISLKKLIKVFASIFEDESIKKVAHNVKGIIKVCSAEGVSLKSFDDVSVMSYALDTGRHKYDLETLIEVYLDEGHAIDSSSVLELYKELIQLLQQAGHISLYEKIDRKMIGSLSQVEKKGVKIDEAYLSNLTSEFKAKIDDISKKVYELSGEEFNIGSPKQLGVILFEKLNIPGGKKSKTGAYSTGAEILETLSQEGYEIAKLVLEWRQYSKLVSTYTEALPKSINLKTNRVHTTLNMVDTSTGRLSSTDPNLQNIPIRTEEGQRIRNAFIVEKGNVMIGADYSQIELRLLAEIAKVDSMKEAFKNNEDIHAITASQMFKVPVDKVDGALRRKAKTINFGIIYGISAFGLSSRLGIPKGEAKEYIESYFEQYPGIKEYMDNIVEYAKKNGFVKSIFGRKCFVKGINDRNFNVRGMAERAAINAPLQGTAADIIKLAMVNMPDEIKQYMILQIHDELLFEVPESKAEEYSKVIKKTMESVLHLSVPLSVDVNIGKSWADCH